MSYVGLIQMNTSPNAIRISFCDGLPVKMDVHFIMWGLWAIGEKLRNPQHCGLISEWPATISTVEPPPACFLLCRLCACSFGSRVPSEAVAAAVALHRIAPFVLLDAHVALWAVADLERQPWGARERPKRT
jgi:hypothetical protein